MLPNLIKPINAESESTYAAQPMQMMMRQSMQPQD
jgi:hypothetical protein